MNKTNTFLVGDTVKRVNGTFAEFRPGDVGVVVEGEMGPSNVRVKHSRTGKVRGMQPWNLELVARQAPVAPIAPIASAKRSQIEERVMTVQLRDVITLTLTPDEADTLRTILRFVGGCPSESRRKHSDSICEALDSVGAKYSEEDVGRDSRRGVHFRPATARRPLDAGDY